MATRRVIYAAVRNGTVAPAIVGFVNAVIQVIIAFGVDVTPGENASIVGLVNVALIAGHQVLESFYRHDPPPADYTGERL